jgi:hypothetical protein
MYTIDLNDFYIYKQVYRKYTPLFHQVNRDIIQLIMQYVGYDDIFNIYDYNDYNSEDDVVEIPIREYHRLQNKRRYNKIQDQLLFNVRGVVKK